MDSFHTSGGLTEDRGCMWKVDTTTRLYPHLLEVLESYAPLLFPGPQVGLYHKEWDIRRYRCYRIASRSDGTCTPGSAWEVRPARVRI